MSSPMHLLIEVKQDRIATDMMNEGDITAMKVNVILLLKF